MYKPRIEVLEETNPTNTFISDFGLQNCEKTNFWWLSHPVCGTLYGSPSKLIQITIKEWSIGP